MQTMVSRHNAGSVDSLSHGIETQSSNRSDKSSRDSRIVTRSIFVPGLISDTAIAETDSRMIRYPRYGND